MRALLDDPTAKKHVAPCARGVDRVDANGLRRSAGSAGDVGETVRGSVIEGRSHITAVVPRLNRDSNPIHVNVDRDRIRRVRVKRPTGNADSSKRADSPVNEAEWVSVWRHDCSA